MREEGPDSNWKEALRSSDDPALRRLGDGLRAAQDRGADELLRRRVWSRVASPPPEAGNRNRTGPWALMLCTAAVGAGLFFFVGRPSNITTPIAEDTKVSPSAPAVPAPAPATPAAKTAEEPLVIAETLQTGQGERLGIQLANGAHVKLDPQTHFQVKAEGAPELKAGKVGLQVPPQRPDTPFVVAAGPYRIRVVGTQFSIEMNTEQVAVGVTEGVVEVERDGRVVRLRAGQSDRQHDCTRGDACTP